MTEKELYKNDPYHGSYQRITEDSLCDEGIENLRIAVLKQACVDLSNSIVNNDQKTEKECRRFFAGNEFGYYSDVSPEILVETSVKRANDFRRFCNMALSCGTLVDGKAAYTCPVCGGDVYVKRKTLYFNPCKHFRSYGREVWCATCYTKKRVEEVRVYADGEVVHNGQPFDNGDATIPK